MKLRWFIVFIWILALAPAPEAAEYGKYDLREAFKLEKSESGKGSMTIDLKYIDRMIADLYRHAGNYPPRFDTYEDKQRAIGDVKNFSGMVEVIINNEKIDKDLLLQYARANSIGHNLDIAGAAQKADATFERILSKNPDHALANYHYGVFLGNSGNADKARRHLEKAIAGGFDRANYSMAIAYVMEGNKAKGIEYLEKYCSKYADDKDAARLMAELRKTKGEIKKGSPARDAGQIKTAQDLNVFMQRYYLNPDPWTAVDAIYFLDKEKVLKSAEHPVIAFFAMVFKSNKSMTAAWEEAIGKTGPETQKHLRQAQAFSNEDDPFLKDPGKHSPGRNDLYWGAFFATGDERYLKQLVDQLKYEDERRDFNLFMTGSSAKWSLTANALGHKKVRQYLERVAGAGGRTGELAREALTKNPEKIRSETIEILMEQKQKGIWTLSMAATMA